MVIDFDLRKSIAYVDDADVRYSFASDNELSAAIRVILKSRAGTIKGTYQETQASNADKIIVYAYRKGTFNITTETQAQGESHILFANSVSSAPVKQHLTDTTYTLALLEEGEYELYYTAYHEDAQTGRMIFQTMLQSQTTVDGSLGTLVTVKVGATIDI